MNIIGMAISFIYFYIVLLSAYKMGKQLEYSRKFAHIMIGNWYFIAIFLFDKLTYASVVPLIFVGYGIYSIYKKKDNFVTGLLRKHNQSAIGIIIFPISLVIILSLSFLYFGSFIPGGIGIAALTYGDSMAALIGIKFPILPFKIGKRTKTLSGCLAMLFFSVVAIYVYKLFLGDYLPFNFPFKFCILLGIVAFLVEIITIFGLDNLTIPLAVFMTYVLLVNT